MNTSKLTVLILALSIGCICSFELNKDSIETLRNTTGFFSFDNSTETNNGTQVMRLDLSMKGISSIAANAFERYKDRIYYLRFYGNKLTKINADAFVGLNNLQTLEFTFNQITEISLPFLPNLNFLSMDLNQISRFDMRVKDLFPKLLQLNVGYNQLTYILPNAFHDSTLEILRLPANGFKTIDVQLFQRMRLRQLYLERNLFTSVTTPFKLLPSLGYLELSGNQISNISPMAFVGIQNLKNLNIYNNKLTTLDPDLFEYIPSIESLTINNNQLTGFPDGIFEHTLSLKYIYAGFNNIQSLQRDLLRTQTYLSTFDVQSNKLTLIPKELFANNKELYVINFAANLLQSIDYNVFEGLSKVYGIYLRQNPFKVSIDAEAIRKIANPKIQFYL